jgi:ATP-dependent DNA helicase RecG
MDKHIQHIIQQGENEQVEFKSSFSDEVIISLVAIREIVLNMIIHRDYRANADSVVKIFDDEIEFYNPGKLPDEISAEDLVRNNYKSTPRNKSIAEFFKNIGWIEKYGSGRIINYFKEANLPLPAFENHSGGFLVTVFAPDNKRLSENVTENKNNDPVNDRLSEIKKLITINKVMIFSESIASRILWQEG